MLIRFFLTQFSLKASPKTEQSAKKGQRGWKQNVMNFELKTSPMFFWPKQAIDF